MTCRVRTTKTLEIYVLEDEYRGYIVIRDKRGLRSAEKIIKENPEVNFIILFDPPVTKMNEKLLKLVRKICTEG